MFNFIFPVISILWEALWNTFDKLNFNKTKLKAQNQMFLVFLIMALWSLGVFLFSFLILKEQVEIKNIISSLLVLIIVIVAIYL